MIMFHYAISPLASQSILETSSMEDVLVDTIQTIMYELAAICRTRFVSIVGLRSSRSFINSFGGVDRCFPQWTLRNF